MINRLCELCGIRLAEQRHHLFSQAKRNRMKYGKRIDHPGNIMYLCSVCHMGRTIPKLTEKEFCEKIGIVFEAKSWRFKNEI